MSGGLGYMWTYETRGCRAARHIRVAADDNHYYQGGGKGKRCCDDDPTVW